MNTARLPDNVIITTENGAVTDAKVRFEASDSSLKVYLYAKEDKPAFVRLEWNTETPNGALMLGDTWERSYGDLCWDKFSGEFIAPWYFLC